ncbi:MAG TPA: HesA/MoeB/ThiF family protein [Methanocella sp.]|jgi:adenylyltransferase/sulfurtransferase
MPAEKLTDYDLKRYNRQMMINGFGEEGQTKLKNTKVFVAGVGGLGCPVSTYLAVAGFGHIAIADMDVVDLSNLNRQMLHWDKNVGEPKVKSGYEKLSEINKAIKISTFEGRIDEDNVYDLTRDSDIIIDAMDNFPTRYLLNRAALKHGIPFIHASIWGLEGRITTIVPGKTPCLECIFPRPPPKEIFPVLGATPAVMATLQATEAVKVILGIGRTLEGRLLLYDGQDMEFDEIRIEKNPACEACGGTHHPVKGKSVAKGVRS